MTDSINTSMIEDLKELMEEDFPILIETFLTDCEKRLDDLKEAISENNAKEIRELAHGFKGSSSNLGAVLLSDISFKLEIMGRENELEEAEHTNQLLNNEYLKVKDYFTLLI